MATILIITGFHNSLNRVKRGWCHSPNLKFKYKNQIRARSKIKCLFSNRKPGGNQMIMVGTYLLILTMMMTAYREMIRIWISNKTAVKLHLIDQTWQDSSMPTTVQSKKTMITFSFHRIKALKDITRLLSQPMLLHSIATKLVHFPS